MNPNSFEKLEYPKAIQQLTSYAQTYPGRKLAEQLRPMTDIGVIKVRLAETSEARALIEKGSNVPLPSLEGMEEAMGLLGTGYIFSERQLEYVAKFIRSCGQLRRFMESKTAVAPTVAAYAASLHDLQELRSAIEGSIDRGRIVDEASPGLAGTRKKIRMADEKLRKRLESLLSRHGSILQERLIGQRNGRYVLPVKKEYRKRVPGIALDESASGQTVFVEPAEAAGLQAELASLRADESREELQVLAGLTETAERYAHELSVNVEAVGYYDFLFAKAKWALAVDGRNVELNETGKIELRGARHPFLAGKAVPLNVAVGGEYRSLLITGPNTGGKTVALKTIGLLTLMAQSGLLVPAEAGSELAVFRSVAADIGDGQSLDRSLSTFSSHLTNVIGILAEAGPDSLVLLDELATGTDPGEGVGLSIAVLEELHRRGAVVAATTHFNEIKEYARAAPGFRNARMAFDEETLRPLYRLEMGEAGNSYAFVIARKLGIGEDIIGRARAIAKSLKRGGAHAAIPGAAPPPAAPPATARANGRRSDRKPRRGTSRPASPSATKAAEADEPHAGDAAADRPLQAGDAVWIPSMRTSGIVYRLPDERGNLIVQVRKEKIKINRKRVNLYIEGKHLYPENYDMDIVFETVENRKKRKAMSKRHVEGVRIEKPPEDG
ncbi:endonuclease MutS2 [Cohnella massiliensis]|uniref:endonuclease MutS2 n=1 Tax=Cohnella massiliensis TaxID=1816691 RepID=UPI0009B9C5E8|nr:DNA mismatch repair protein MutS [Cohnella massiliensis]